MDIDPFSMVNDNVLYTDFINYSLVIDNGENVLLFDQNQQTKELSEPFVESFALPEGYSMLTPSGSSTVYQLSLVASNRGLYTNETNYDGRLELMSIAPANIIKLYTENRLLDNSAPLGLINLNQDYYDVELEIIRSSNSKLLSDLLAFYESGLNSYVKNRDFNYESKRYNDIQWKDYESEIKGNRPLLICAIIDGLYYFHVGIGSAEMANGGRYMALYSGWKPTIVYLNYNSEVFEDISAYAVSITHKYYEI